MSTLLAIAILLLLVFFNGVFAMAEMALVSARRARLTALGRKGVHGANAALALAGSPDRFLPTVQLGVTLVGIVSGTFGGARLAGRLAPYLKPIPYLGKIAEGAAFTLVVLAITGVTLILGELVPKQLALRAPEAIAMRLAPPLAWLSRATAPVVWLLGRSSDLVLDVLGLRDSARPAITEEELQALLTEGAHAGVLEMAERDMIQRVLRLADKPVRAIMTPRNEIAWLDRSDGSRDIAAKVRASSHSRFVVSDRTIDNVVGVVQAKDILDRVLEGREMSLAAALRQPLVIPDTATAQEAMERLRGDALGLALVMDEYGSFEGVVTSADVLEAIVGELAASGYTSPSQAAVRQGMLLMDGMTAVDELKARLVLPDLPAEGSYHTLGGLVLALLRRVPRLGDKAAFGGWVFEVLEMDGRRVVSVRARRESWTEA